MAYYRGSKADLQSRRAVIAQDIGQWDTPLPILLSQDALVTGVQSLDLPPRARPRSTDYTWIQSASLAIFQELPWGRSTASTELPPRGVARARDYSLTVEFPPVLIGQDQLPTGLQLGGNAPAGRQRATSLSEPGVNLTILLPVAGATLPDGKTTLGTDLPPRGTPRARDYSQTTTILPQLAGQDRAYGDPGQVPTFDIPNPPRGAPRARDYSIANGFPQELIGQDQFFGAAGETTPLDWPYRPTKAVYRQGTGEPLQDLLSTLLAAAASSAPAGAQLLDLPPRLTPRARDYSWELAFPLVLVGQDALVTGIQISGNPPRGRARLVDYTFLASFPLELIGQDAMTAGDQLVDLPYPPGRRWARDYTWAADLPVTLLGQDAMVPGAQMTALAPRGAAKSRDYTHIAIYALANTTPTRDLSYTIGSPDLKWRTGEPRLKWIFRPPQE